MKILYIITKSEMGGAQTHVAQLAEWMKVQGHKVFVMSSPGGWLGARCKSLGAEFIPNPYFKNSYSPINLMRALFLVRKTVREIRPDVIHCHSGGGGFYGRLATIGMPVRKIFTVHGWSFRAGVPWYQRAIGWLAEFLMRPFTDHVICVSDFDRRLGLRSCVIGEKTSRTIHNGVAIPPADHSATPGTHDTFAITFVGRFAAPKRQDLLIQAVSRLPDDLKKRVVLNLVAYGPKQQFLENLATEYGIRDQVFFLSVPTEKVGEIYQKTDLYALFSDYEAFPISILEAMSYGLPIIASDVGGVGEAVDETVGVLVSKHADPKHIARELEALLFDPERLRTLGRHARSRAIERFTAEAMCATVSHIYDQVCR